LPGATIKNALDVAERIRRVVEETSVEDGDQRINVNISAGVAVYPDQPTESEIALLDHADKKLYIAKREGRNQVVH